VLPNLIVIGAFRSGTTSLHRYLGEHPEIFMARAKELAFFVEELNWRRGIRWYEAQFPEAAPVRGESSPEYTVYPLWKGVPERMAPLLPETKLIYLVRDPIPRLLSMYSLQLASGPASLDLADELAGPRRSWYVEASLYHMQLQRFTEHFPRERILVIDSADLQRATREVLRSVFRFLDVDPDFVSPSFDTRHNPTPALMARAGWRKVGGLIQAAIGLERYQRLAPLSRVPGPLRPVLLRKLELPPLDPGLRTELETLFREDAARLREFTGLSLATWSV
jgi:Sulfotransferase domain